MRVLALNPPSKYSKNVARDLLFGCWCKGKRIAGVQFPPLPLLGVATTLRAEGIDATLLDAAGERRSLEEVKRSVGDYDLVVMNTATAAFDEDASFLNELKAAHPHLRTVLFGTHVTFMPESSLVRPGVDVIVLRGDHEFIIRDLVRETAKGGDSWQEVRGIGFLRDGRVVINEAYPFIRDLDAIPIPDRTLLPKEMEYYNPIVKRIPATTALTSRGCPAKCTYCCAPTFYGTRYRYRSPESVLEELELLQELGYREVFYRDEVFTLKRERVVQICKGILDRKIDMTWICSSRTDSVDKPMLELMREAGCHMIRFGVESGVQDLLDRMKKGVTVERVRQTFRWAHEVGMDTHAHMMIGVPGESRETIQRTLDFVDEIRPTTVTYGITTPYPGTPLFDEVAQADPTIGDGSVIGLRELHTTGRFNRHYTALSSEELSQALRDAYRRYYLRPSYVWMWLKKIQSFDELKRVSLAATTLYDFILQGE
jgi:radical SAM superfamily enzyme YgiQ (UPF0313 family)